MQLFVGIAKSGDTINYARMVEGAVPLFATEAARNWIFEKLGKEMGGFCKRCHLLARSSELGEDNICLPNLGCSVDSDISHFGASDVEAQLWAAQFPNQVYAAFLAKLPHRGDPVPELGEEW